MFVKSIQTHKITSKDKDLIKIIDKYITNLSENSVVVITSKIVSICEGRIVPVEGTGKDELIKEESQYYLPRESNPYHVSLTITRNNLAASAGIDESNADGYYVLWPADPQETTNKVRKHLSKKFTLKNIGVIISDSKTTPFRWGVTAFSIAHSGFNALKDYIGTPDLFGRKFQFEKLNIADSLATTAAVVMGEGSEQTPLAVITELPFVEFQDRNPTEEELESLKIQFESDLYTPILSSVKWERGKKF